MSTTQKTNRIKKIFKFENIRDVFYLKFEFHFQKFSLQNLKWLTDSYMNPKITSRS